MDHALPDHDVLERLSRLEEASARLERSARRWRTATALLAATGAASILIAAVRPASVPLVQTQRLEVLSAEGEVIAVIGGDERGGRLDIWSGEGRNVLRASVNEHGGDLNIWNVDERSVAATFATEGGGTMRLWNRSGERMLHAGSAEGAGALTLSAADGSRLDLRASVAAPALSVHPQGGEAVIAIGVHRAGGGHLHLADAAGTALVRAEALPGGRSSLALHDGDGRRRAVLSASADGGALAMEQPGGTSAATFGAAAGGGFLDLYSGAGQRTVRASGSGAGGGALALSAAAGHDVFTVEGTEQGGATLALMGSRNRRAIVAGGRAEGGVINLFNRHDVAVLAASYAPDGLGGAFSLRNGRGIAVVEVTCEADETGLVRVMDSEGERARRLAPLP